MYGHERSLVEGMTGRPFVLLGVNSDKEKSTAKDAVKDNNLNWRSGWDKSTQGDISSSFKISGWPTIFLIDHEGVIQAKNLRGSRLDTAIEQLVARAEGDGAEGGPFASEWRTFEDSQGKFQVEARLIGMDGGEVILLKRLDQVEINVPLKRLSKKDQAFSRTEIKRLNAMNRL
jgi:hypothetical protein